MKAIIFNLLAWVMLPIMDGIAKYLSADLPVLQITWARYFFTVFFTLPIMFFLFKKYLVWTKKPKLQFLRGLILLIANICFFYSISVISLAKALTLAFIAPLIVTSFSPFFLGEKVGYRRWLAVIIGFVGSLVVIRPGFVEINFCKYSSVNNRNYVWILFNYNSKIKFIRQSIINFVINWCSRGYNYFLNHANCLGTTIIKSMVINGCCWNICMHRAFLFNFIS